MPEIPKTSLPRKQEGGRLGAGHLNKLSEAAEKVFGEAYKPGGSAAGPTNPFQMRRVEITARGCDGVFDEDNDGYDEIFTVVPQYWTGTSWERDDEGAEWCLDCSMIQNAFPWIGDVFVAYYDPQRVAFIPIQVEPKHLEGRLETDLLAAVNHKTDPSTATAFVYRKNSDGDLEEIRDPDTNELVRVTLVNRFENISVDAETYIRFEWLNREWKPYAADCPPESSSSSSSG